MHTTQLTPGPVGSSIVKLVYFINAFYCLPQLVRLRYLPQRDDLAGLAGPLKKPSGDMDHKSLWSGLLFYVRKNVILLIPRCKVH